MMESPQSYYEEQLKGKSAEEIEAQICSLKQEISRLKKVVAKPQEYMAEWGICPHPDVQLQMHRLYLQEAKIALKDLGSAELSV